MNIPKNLKKFFKDLGFKTKDIGNDVGIRCPFHNDKDPSLLIRKADGIWNCFGCGESGKFSKLMEKLGIDFDLDEVGKIEAMPDSEWERIVETLTEVNHELTLSFRKEYENMTSFFNGIDVIPDKKIFRNIYKYMKNRGFSNQTLARFNLSHIFKKTYKNKKYWNRALIPVLNENGRFLWAEARRIDDIKDRKYIRPFGSQTSNVFFNYSIAKFNPKEVVVVEGIFDTMMLTQWGYNSIANFGVRTSEKKLNLLSVFDKVICCFDNDIKKTNAQKLQDKAIATAKGRGYDIFKISLPLGRDICEMSKEEFDEV